MGVVSVCGEPVSIGRQTLIWPALMRRAIISRDRHCQFPGCQATRALTIHHIRSWLHGGKTSVDNAMCLCQAHHTLVHEGGYRTTRRSEEPRRFDITAPDAPGRSQCKNNHVGSKTNGSTFAANTRGGTDQECDNDHPVESTAD